LPVSLLELVSLVFPPPDEPPRPPEHPVSDATSSAVPPMATAALVARVREIILTSL
jgi:hypothetical protein